MSDDLREIRLAKLEAMREAGIQPFPDRFDRTHTSTEARALDDGAKDVKVAGRIMAVRSFGSLTFVGIRDWEGDVQLSFEKKTLGPDDYKAFGKRFDIGDFIGASGERFTTKKGSRPFGSSRTGCCRRPFGRFPKNGTAPRAPPPSNPWLVRRLS